MTTWQSSSVATAALPRAKDRGRGQTDHPPSPAHSPPPGPGVIDPLDSRGQGQTLRVAYGQPDPRRRPHPRTAAGTRARRMNQGPYDAGDECRGDMEAGSGSPHRRARSVAAQLNQARTGTARPSASKRIDAASLRPGCEGKANASSATPPTMRASATRIQARKVHSLASVNRGLGSTPREYIHFGNRVLVIGSWLAGQRARTIGLLHSAVAGCQRIGASAWLPSRRRQAAR